MKIIDEKVYYSWKDYALDMHDIDEFKIDHVVVRNFFFGSFFSKP